MGVVVGVEEVGVSVGVGVTVGFGFGIGVGADVGGSQADGVPPRRLSCARGGGGLFRRWFGVKIRG